MVPHCCECGFPFLLYTGVTLGIELQRSRTVTESVNLTIEYCVVIIQPDITAPIERGGFSVCASSVDGTATGKQTKA